MIGEKMKRSEYYPGWCSCGDPEEVCRSYNGGKSCLDKERERLDMDLSLTVNPQSQAPSDSS